MTTMNVELYDALVDGNTDDAKARAAAESVPAISEFAAPKNDLAKLTAEIGRAIGELTAEIGKLSGEIGKMEARITRTVTTLSSIIIALMLGIGSIMVTLFLSYLPLGSP